MRSPVFALLSLTALVVVACGGGAEANEQPTSTEPASSLPNAVTPTTPVPAPPWVSGTTTSSATESSTLVPVDTTIPVTSASATQPAAPTPAQPTSKPAQPTSTPAQLTPTPSPAFAMSAHVSIQDNKFVDRTVTIGAGGTVTWRHDGEVPHNLIAAAFDSGLMDSGETFSFTFSTPGTYQYECTIHTLPRPMSGTVVVK